MPSTRLGQPPCHPPQELQAGHAPLASTASQLASRHLPKPATRHWAHGGGSGSGWARQDASPTRRRTHLLFTIRTIFLIFHLQLNVGCAARSPRTPRGLLAPSTWRATNNTERLLRCESVEPQDWALVEHRAWGAYRQAASGRWESVALSFTPPLSPQNMRRCSRARHEQRIRPHSNSFTRQQGFLAGVGRQFKQAQAQLRFHWQARALHPGTSPPQTCHLAW